MVTKLAINTTPLIKWQQTTPVDGKFITFQDFEHVIAKVKDLVYREDVIGVTFDNKFIEDNYNCSKTIESGDKYQKEFRTYKIIGFNRKLSDYGILGQSGFDKSLPQGIHEWDKESLSRFIAGLFDTDGYVTLDKPFKFRIAFCQSNYSLLSEVKELLLKFGIHSYIKKSSAKKTEYKGHAIKPKTSYVLVIKDILSTKRFIENISLNISYKKENLQKISDIIKIKKRRDNSYYDGIKAVCTVNVDKESGISISRSVSITQSVT